MMINEYGSEGTIVLTEKEFKNNLANKVGEICLTLTSAKYEVLVSNDDLDIYNIEYCYDPKHTPEFGANRFLVVTAEEEEELYSSRLDDEEETE